MALKRASILATSVFLVGGLCILGGPRMEISKADPQAMSPEQQVNVGCDGVANSGKVMKACGCDKPAGPCGCSPCPEAPAPTPTFTPTCGAFVGHVQVDPTPTGSVTGARTKLTFEQTFPPPADESPSCLATLRDKIRMTGDNWSRTNGTAYRDDYTIIWFMDELSSLSSKGGDAVNLRTSVFYSPSRANASVCNPACTLGAPARIPVCWCDKDGYDNFASSTTPPSPAQIDCLSRAPVGQLGYHHWEGLCVDFKVYFDKSCKVIPPSEAQHTRICDALQAGANLNFWPSSPISLMWDATRAITAHGSVVEFALNKGSKETWYMWYGSEETPLLVYDPKHTGSVTSADQLFGNWTFGGKRTASLSTAPSGVAGSWRDGYEALATLDANHDGEISGSELEPLALWFDKGRDAVARPGEVVSLEQAGVTKLFVGPGVVDPSTRNIHVKAGYVRHSPTGEKVGESVDWYSVGALSQSDLIVKQQFAAEQERGLSELSSLLPSVPASDPALPRERTFGKVIKDSPVRGAWFWKSKEDTQKTSRGVLVLEHLEGDRVIGYASSEIPLRDGSGKLQSILKTKAISGSVTKEADGTYRISFSSIAAPDPSGKKSPASVTEARLGGESTSLSGETTEELGPGKKMSYQWVAAR